MELEEKQTEILIRLNREHKLNELFKLLGLESLLSPQPLYRFESMKDGKIIVFGDSQTSEKILLGIAKNLGIDKNKIEFYLNYQDITNYDFRKLQWSMTYSLIMFGPVPHSCVGKGNNSSIINAIETSEAYPPVIRLGTGELKITKSSFKTQLSKAINDGIITLN